MSPALKFIIRIKLDTELMEAYRIVRSLLKDHNFTEEEVKNVTYMPDELMRAHMKYRGKVDKLLGNLYRYGFIDSPETMPEDVNDYMKSRLIEIEQEYPLDGNTGFYGEEGPFGRPDKMF